MCVRHRHSWITAKAAMAGDWARCHDLLYIQCGCVMQFGAKRCAQWAKRGCTGHDGRAKPAWAARTRPAGAPHSVRRSQVLHGRAGHGRRASRGELPGGAQKLLESICLSFCQSACSVARSIFSQTTFSPRNMLSLTLSVLYTRL
jgi:hypothetical protein